MLRMLRVIRALRGLSQDDLARRAKVSRQLIATIETGRNRDPRLSTLTRIAEALDLSVEDLIRLMRDLESRYARDSESR